MLPIKKNLNNNLRRKTECGTENKMLSMLRYNFIYNYEHYTFKQLCSIYTDMYNKFNINYIQYDMTIQFNLKISNKLVLKIVS